MIVGILTVELRIPESASLKEKRMAIKSLKDRIRNTFNVSVAEVAGQEKWQVSTLGIAYVGTEKIHVDQALAKVVDFIDRSRQVDLINYNMEML